MRIIFTWFMDIKPATPSLDPLTKRHNWSWRCASKSLRSAWRCWEMQALDQKDLCQTPTEVQSSLSLDIFGYTCSARILGSIKRIKMSNSWFCLLGHPSTRYNLANGHEWYGYQLKTSFFEFWLRSWVIWPFERSYSYRIPARPWR